MAPSCRIVFMGTPEFAVPSLKALIEAGHDIPAVVTQPDRPRGRGRRLEPPPVKLAAKEHGIEVLQPSGVREEGFMEKLKALEPDFLAVVAYGKILPRAVLDIPAKGCINLHASLLPKYRGAAPINRAIIDGEKETGVTTMLMDAGLDTGPMLLKERVAIGEEETAVELSQRLSVVGAGLLARTIGLLTEGRIEPEPQDARLSTYAPALKKTDGLIDWGRSAGEVRDLVRGLYPWPGAFTRWKGKVLKIHEGRVSKGGAGGAGPGTIVSVDRDALGVKCAEGVFEVTSLQPENKRRMGAGDFIKGYRVTLGETFS